MKRVFAMIAIASWVSLPVSAEVPRTAWGKPSLQGTWDFRSITPFERPARFEGREFLTAEEIQQMEEARAAGSAAAANVDFDEAAKREGQQGDVDVGYNSFFLDSGTRFSTTMRTSMVIDPPDGRVPKPSQKAIDRYVAMRDTWAKPPGGPEDRNPFDRCLKGFNGGPPMTPGAYNNIMQIVESKDFIAMQVEMVNDHRIIPTSGGSALPDTMRFWNGVSQGAWDGDTFVVTTTNFNDLQMYRLTGRNLKLTERFTRLDADTLEYKFTVDDPDTYDRPWTAVMHMQRTDDDVFEYACHEGNYAMSLMLKGARKQDKDGTAANDNTWLPSWSK
jgi:hypothetical protein